MNPISRPLATTPRNCSRPSQACEAIHRRRQELGAAQHVRIAVDDVSLQVPGPNGTFPPFVDSGRATGVEIPTRPGPGQSRRMTSS